MNRLLILILLILPVICLAGEFIIPVELNNLLHRTLEISSEKSANITAHPNWRLLNSDRCGIASFDRIVGGVDAPIGAYPWLARIGYLQQHARWMPPIFECAGAVINELHVLTAAHCVSNLPNKLIPVRIRLGEHNLHTDPDCENSFCNDPYEDYEIARVIPHEAYDPVSMKNDIALIQVRKQITFTEFVEPICVVSGNLLEKNFTGNTVEVAGWGIFDIDNPVESTILQAIKLPVLPTTRCSNDVYYEKFSIDSRQICLGGTVGMDSCKGDSGGPVMKIETGEKGTSPRYYVIAIVSFGPGDCGNEDVAGIYTDVSKYILWVLDHLRA